MRLESILCIAVDAGCLLASVKAPITNISEYGSHGQGFVCLFLIRFEIKLKILKVNRKKTNFKYPAFDVIFCHNCHLILSRLETFGLDLKRNKPNGYVNNISPDENPIVSFRGLGVDKFIIIISNYVLQ